MTLHIPFFQVDAFSDQAFSGNPAAVMPLHQWLDSAVLQSIAAENNLSETAFLVGGEGHYQLRWFTPTIEVDLCGHATLASAHILMTELGDHADILLFETKSGELQVTRTEQRLTLNFPAAEASVLDSVPKALIQGLGATPESLMLDASGRNYYAVFRDETCVRSLVPDMGQLTKLEHGVVVTAPGDNSDCVSRYFAPGFGIPEDPVTGSIHCVLVPYWGKRLGHCEILAHQVSQRGGSLHCRLVEGRVEMTGDAITVIKGYFELDQSAAGSA